MSRTKLAVIIFVVIIILVATAKRETIWDLFRYGKPVIDNELDWLS